MVEVKRNDTITAVVNKKTTERNISFFMIGGIVTKLIHILGGEGTTLIRLADYPTYCMCYKYIYSCNSTLHSVSSL